MKDSLLTAYLKVNSPPKYKIFHDNHSSCEDRQSFLGKMKIQSILIFGPHGRLPAAVYFCPKGKKCPTDYPHWPITRTPKPKKIMLLYYRDKNSQTWSDENSMGSNPVEAPKTLFGFNLRLKILES